MQSLKIQMKMQINSEPDAIKSFTISSKPSYPLVWVIIYQGMLNPFFNWRTYRKKIIIKVHMSTDTEKYLKEGQYCFT